MLCPEIPSNWAYCNECQHHPWNQITRTYFPSHQLATPFASAHLYSHHTLYSRLDFDSYGICSSSNFQMIVITKVTQATNINKSIKHIKTHNVYTIRELWKGHYRIGTHGIHPSNALYLWRWHSIRVIWPMLSYSESNIYIHCLYDLLSLDEPNAKALGQTYVMIYVHSIGKKSLGHLEVMDVVGWKLLFCPSTRWSKGHLLCFIVFVLIEKYWTSKTTNQCV